jgi:hypothetical protein
MKMVAEYLEKALEFEQSAALEKGRRGEGQPACPGTSLSRAGGRTRVKVASDPVVAIQVRHTLNLTPFEASDELPIESTGVQTFSPSHR